MSVTKCRITWLPFFRQIIVCQGRCELSRCTTANKFQKSCLHIPKVQSDPKWYQATALYRTFHSERL